VTAASHLGRFGARSARRAKDDSLELTDGSRVGVVGGGPAGSFFSFFLLSMAKSIGLDVAVDVYEPRLFTHRGPAGCNHCGGIVSESLVQMLAAEGINLPPTVVQQGIESYVLHTDQGDVRIQSPRNEKRIAAVYRGNGPRESEPIDVAGFDRHLLELTSSSGASIVRKLARSIGWNDGRPRITSPDGTSRDYDLLVLAVGVNSQAHTLFAESAPQFNPPQTQRTFICEFRLGADVIAEAFGPSMHVFLLDIPRLGFAAIVPKGEFVTLCLLGDELDDELVERFLSAPELARCFPGGAVPPMACHCYPRINVDAAVCPFADRMVWIGDCGVARLYKDGIGSAYRTSKAAARTAVFHGVSASDFRRHFWPACRSLDVDNTIAKVVFGVTHLIQRSSLLRRGVVRMTAREQARPGSARRMSSVLWDTFTGSAPYRDILLRALHPGFPLALAWNVIASAASFGGRLSLAEANNGE
jgi:flavin-dependent dehydrogenase